MKKIRLPKISLIVLMFATVASSLLLSCAHVGSVIPPTDPLHKATNAVYYWRTTFDLTEDESKFLVDHKVERMYLRMYDVVLQADEAVPNATISFNRPLPEGLEVVPVVFITVEAMQSATDDGRISALADKIIERTTRISEWNAVNWTELQLDCDWTASTRQSFFALCKAVKNRLPQGKLLSSTIRLHQLQQEAPPVDYGVLMVYNTDNFRNPETSNSILNDETVEEFLNRPFNFTLPLDIALPIYQWDLVFDQNDKFLRIAAPGSWPDYSDDSEHVKYESVPFATLDRTQQHLKKYLHMQPGRYSTVLYHLDSININEFTSDEIESLYNN